MTHNTPIVYYTPIALIVSIIASFPCAMCHVPSQAAKPDFGLASSQLRSGEFAFAAVDCTADGTETCSRWAVV
jgi:hypothetical protein